MKHILEYEDHEIEDLIGDLVDVGVGEKLGFAIWAKIQILLKPVMVLLIENLIAPQETQQFYPIPSQMQEMIMTRLREGKFETPDEGKPGGIQIFETVLGKANLQQMAKESAGMPAFLNELEVQLRAVTKANPDALGLEGYQPEEIYAQGYLSPAGNKMLDPETQRSLLPWAWQEGGVVYKV